MSMTILGGVKVVAGDQAGMENLLNLEAREPCSLKLPGRLPAPNNFPEPPATDRQQVKVVAPFDHHDVW